MIHRFAGTVNAGPSPYSSHPPDDPLPSTHATQQGLRRSKYNASFQPTNSLDRDDAEWRGSYGLCKNNRQSGRTSLSPIHSEDESRDNFDPGNSRTWGMSSSSFIHNGTLLPVSRQGVSRFRGLCGDSEEENDNGSMLRSPSMSSPQVLAPDSDQFLKLVDDNLRFETLKSTSPSADILIRRVRSASSSYPSQDHDLSRVQSPESAAGSNRLSFSDIERFGRANDCLSNLRSNSPSTDFPVIGSEADSHEAVEEASTAIAGWQDEPRKDKLPYNRYELAESSEDLPCDSQSQHFSRPVVTPATPSPATSNGPKPSDNPVLDWDSIHAAETQIRGQYDGIHDAYHKLTSPDPAQAFFPCTPTHSQPSTWQSKRKASHFSLRSLSNSFKRPRLGFRKWASHVYHQSSRRLSQACQKWRLAHNHHDRRAFEAWKAKRREENPEQPDTKKEQTLFGAYSMGENEDWWHDGTKRFEAPKWMLFRGSISRRS